MLPSTISRLLQSVGFGGEASYRFAQGAGEYGAVHWRGVVSALLASGEIDGGMVACFDVDADGDAEV